MPPSRKAKRYTPDGVPIDNASSDAIRRAVMRFVGQAAFAAEGPKPLSVET